ncbi:MAG: T9SS type A sorting domain-containing protein [Sporocytophaga sp.]|uniref:T9SS type A sorting domain-containing protein n=1 Tax=Sporocytophaga sp. TaxID=2231183 RepID=UPI001B2E459D|nr:T9SS type A sorting domain-containing protein [Sporocytophaga sp.]MBO9702850.1 T9SS type A sorting domain-containing protein [Sporocytophaga sp.]
MKRKQLLFFIAVIGCITGHNSYAGHTIVTNNSDAGPGSLREAITSSASGDTITFSPSLNNSTITLTSGEMVISNNLMIQGPGEDKLTINGNFDSPVFIIEPNINVFLSGIKISEGFYFFHNYRTPYGAIFNQGNLIMEKSTLSNNYAGAIYNKGLLSLTQVKILRNSIYDVTDGKDAGGIVNDGTATITDCEINENSGSGTYSGGAGGIFNNGTMSIFNSSISKNGTSGQAGGIENRGILSLYNSTISGNETNSKGGSPAGISNAGTLTMEFCTVVYNFAESMDGYWMSGIYSYGNLTFKGCIIALNGPEQAYLDAIQFKDDEQHTYFENALKGIDGWLTGTVNDLGYNFIGINDEFFNLTNPTNKCGSITGPIKPLIGPLQNNGGFASSHALLPGSRCINGVPYSGPAIYDQRGRLRSWPDIGAYEFINTPSVRITNPLSNASFDANSDIQINAQLSDDVPYLLVNSVAGYKKLKLGYDSIGIYHANKNVLSGGNNKLEITLKDFNGNADWTKIQVRPNGSTVNPVALAPYVNQVGGVGAEFTTITIPLSAFDASIDFTHLIVLELPYSVNAPSFKIGISKILFSGGTSPFLWFGGSKTDNSFDGASIGGQLYAGLVPATQTDCISKVEFFNGTSKIGEDVSAPYSINWTNVPEGSYLITAIGKTIYDETIASVPVNIVVNPLSLEALQRSGSIETSERLIYPNPVTDKVVISSDAEDANIIIVDINGNIHFQQKYNTLQGGQADLSLLPSGIYFMRIEGQQSKKVVKLVKL